jgi:divalent metal cation (Fe/Co/Zn/Cd) transporter
LYHRCTEFRKHAVFAIQFLILRNVFSWLITFVIGFHGVKAMEPHLSNLLGENVPGRKLSRLTDTCDLSRTDGYVERLKYYAAL